jgi:hypothetical protein
MPTLQKSVPAGKRSVRSTVRLRSEVDRPSPMAPRTPAKPRALAGAVVLDAPLGFRRVQHDPEAGDPPIDDVRDVRAGDDDRPVPGAAFPAQDAEPVMPDRDAIGREAEVRPELLEKLAGDLGDRRTAHDDGRRLVHDRFGDEELIEGALALRAVAFVEDAFEIRAQQAVVVRRVRRLGLVPHDSSSGGGDLR